MANYYHPDSDYYRKVLDTTPPTFQTHATEEDIRANMKQLKPYSWRLEGNKLIGMTDWGELVNHIPTDYILEGTDDKGLPIFRKIVV